MPDELIHCVNPLCGDQGWYPDYDRNGDVVQVQCEFCWSNPLSYFNAFQQSVERTVSQEEPLRDDEFSSWDSDPGYW